MMCAVPALSICGPSSAPMPVKGATRTALSGGGKGSVDEAAITAYREAAVDLREEL